MICPKMQVWYRKSLINRGNFDSLSLVWVLSPFLLMITVAFVIPRIILDVVYSGFVVELT